MKRYPITDRRKKLYYGTSSAMLVVRKLVESGKLTCKELALREDERLDHVAHKYYGSSQLWWIIAAASGIGWGLQCPAGTYIKIPQDLSIISSAL
ncbi:hypothetical protein OAA09_01315 [bacterium]|nr:hypothetical protein [bacterium]